MAVFEKDGALYCDDRRKFCTICKEPFFMRLGQREDHFRNRKLCGKHECTKKNNCKRQAEAYERRRKARVKSQDCIASKARRPGNPTPEEIEEAKKQIREENLAKRMSLNTGDGDGIKRCV